MRGHVILRLGAREPIRIGADQVLQSLRLLGRRDARGVLRYRNRHRAAGLRGLIQLRRDGGRHLHQHLAHARLHQRLAVDIDGVDRGFGGRLGNEFLEGGRVALQDLAGLGQLGQLGQPHRALLGLSRLGLARRASRAHVQRALHERPRNAAHHGTDAALIGGLAQADVCVWVGERDAQRILQHVLSGLLRAFGSGRDANPRQRGGRFVFDWHGQRPHNLVDRPSLGGSGDRRAAQNRQVLVELGRLVGRYLIGHRVCALRVQPRSPRHGRHEHLTRQLSQPRSHVVGESALRLRQHEALARDALGARAKVLQAQQWVIGRGLVPKSVGHVVTEQRAHRPVNGARAHIQQYAGAAGRHAHGLHAAAGELAQLALNLPHVAGVVVHQLGAIHISQQPGRGWRGLHQRIEVDAAHAGLALDLLGHVLRRDERHTGFARQALRLGVHVGIGVSRQHEAHAGAHDGVGLGRRSARHGGGRCRQFAFVEFAHDGARKLLTDLAMAARSAALRAS